MFDYSQVPEYTAKASVCEERHKNREKGKAKNVPAAKPHVMEGVQNSEGKSPLIPDPNWETITPGPV
jgi:hypothetical protein